MTEWRAIELSWCEVRDIAETEIAGILGSPITCGTSVTGTEFWTLLFDCRLPLPKLCQLLQAIQATPDDWEDALPDEGESSETDAIGMVQAEKLIGRYLGLRWQYRLITADSLWLVGVEEVKCES